MHEASIAGSLLDIAVRECRGKGYSRIVSIKICIGMASGVMPEALLFAFDALKTDTIAGEASLDIEEKPVSGFCRACEKDFTVDEEFIFNCPSCGSGFFEVRSGRELNIVELEVD